MEEVLNSSLNRPKKPTYSQDWPVYNFVQTNERDLIPKLLKSLCEGIEEPPRVGPKGGRPKMPLSDMVVAVTMHIYGLKSGRRAASDMREYESKGLFEKTPHYNTIFKYLESPEMTPVLKGLLAESAMPFREIERCFATDSTGFGTFVYSDWYGKKWKRTGSATTKNHWVKVHLCCGMKTNAITAIEITDEHVHDVKRFPALFEATLERFQVDEILADRGYLKDEFLQLAESHGVTPYIKFKKHITGKTGSPIWKKMFAMFQYKHDEFMAHYGMRSNVETTMWMLKSKFGARVRSRTKVAQENEMLCKCLCHNLCCLVSAVYELGLEVEFWKETRAVA